MSILGNHLKKSAAATQAAAPQAQSTPAPTEPTTQQLKPVEATVQAAAPAAAPRKLFGGTKAAVPVQAPVQAPVAPAPKPAPTPVATKPVENRALSTFDPFALITGTGSDDANSVLAFVLEEADKAPSFDGPFPMIALGKGNSNSGGKWQYGSNVPAELRAVLPAVTDSFTAVFLGYRVYGLAWAEGMKDKDEQAAANALRPNATQAPAQDKAQPLWKVTIGCGDVANVQAAMKAGEAYQYTKRVEKAEKFDGLGHFRPGVEMVFFTVNPVDNSPVVFAIKLPDHYTSTQRALENLGRTMAGLGGLKAAPLEITPYSTEEKGAKSWSCHSIRVQAAATKQGMALWEAFSAIKADLLADADFSRDFSDWNKTDATPEALEALHHIAGMAK